MANDPNISHTHVIYFCECHPYPFIVLLPMIFGSSLRCFRWKTYGAYWFFILRACYAVS